MTTLPLPAGARLIGLEASIDCAGSGMVRDEALEADREHVNRRLTGRTCKKEVILARTQAIDYEQRKEAIVEKSAELFARLGFSVASVANIAKACNTSKSLIYHYYPSKEDILNAVMSSHIDQLIEDVEEVLSQGGEPCDRLRLLLHAFMAHYVGAADRQKVLLNELSNLPQEARVVIVRKQRTVIDAVQRLIIELYPDLGDNPARARAQTMLLFGMINWTHTWFDPSGTLSFDDIAEMAFALIKPR